nr:hypothetical protein Iba_scaffold1676962CG0010 [Ipomoea batatas]
MVYQACNVPLISCVNNNIFTDLKKLTIFPLNAILCLPQISNTSSHLLTTILKNHLSFWDVSAGKKTPSVYARSPKANPIIFRSL